MLVAITLNVNLYNLTRSAFLFDVGGHTAEILSVDRDISPNAIGEPSSVRKGLAHPHLLCC